MLRWNPRLFSVIGIGILILITMLLVDNYIVKSNTQFSPKVLASSDYYKVRDGDSLFAIAGKYGTSVDTIQKTNGLTNTTLEVGQVLEIPLEDKAGVNWYTVESGDSLHWIADKYGVSVAALQAANMLKSDAITLGQILLIPEKGWEPPVVQKPALEKIQMISPQSALEKPAVLPLRAILRQKGLFGVKLALVVDKSDHVLSVYAGNRWLKSYHVELGDSGLADKQVSGDHKTPEGILYIAEKSVLNPADDFLGSRWLRLSYPTIEDADRGSNQGIIDGGTRETIIAANRNREIPPQNTALGGGVGIHGGSKASLGKDWTWGCVGLRDEDVEDFYDYVSVGITVVIRS